MIQGTASSVGKSLLVTALSRIFLQDGYRVAPFKSQNMALNSFITEEGLEMGRAQVVQAEACKIKPSVLMNPILLKPTTDKKSQVIIRGKAHKNMSAREYYKFKPALQDMVRDTYRELEKEKDIIVMEGAGSPAEINLRDKDIVNMGMAELVDAPVILVGDIDKGGVFASLAGTMLLLNEEEKRRVKGVIINKFRGDIKILEPGLKMIEDIIKIPVLGVVPYTALNIEDEDSVTERFKKHKLRGEVDVEILYLPRVSNFTDFNVFETQADINIRYVMKGENTDNPDILIIPGSKNTIEDLIYLKNSGLEKQIIQLSRKGKIIIGVCGGYQMLGKEISDPEGTESGIANIAGIGLLDMTTVFEKEKVTTQIEGEIKEGWSKYLKGLEGCGIKGYEIHMGRTSPGKDTVPFTKIKKSLDKEVDITDGFMNKAGNVMGTYIHGIFDSIEFIRGLVNNIRKEKGLKAIKSDINTFEEFKDKEYDKLASLVRKSIDMKKVYEILNSDW